MTDRPILFSPAMIEALLAGRKTQTRRVLKSGVAPLKVKHAIGDRLWVREAWRTDAMFDDVKPSQLSTGAPLVFETGTEGFSRNIGDGMAKGKYRPPMFMPRWASRLTLHVTDVRVERVQDISDEDALAEGIEMAIAPIAGTDIDIDGEFWPGGPRRMFKELWDSLNKERGFGWAQNPWVSATTFTLEKANIEHAS